MDKLYQFLLFVVIMKYSACQHVWTDGANRQAINKTDYPPRMFRDAPDSLLINCKVECMRRNKDACETYSVSFDNNGVLTHSCFSICDPAWQYNWNLLTRQVKRCLGRWLIAYRAFNDMDCGISRTSFIDLDKLGHVFKIENGRNAGRYQFPWILQIRSTRSDGKTNKTATGVYIGKGYILCAAHSVRKIIHDYNHMTLSVHGGHNRQNDMVSSGISKVMIHPQPDNCTDCEIDLAMIKMTKLLQGVVPICIAKRSLPIPPQIVGVGWGTQCTTEQLLPCHGLSEDEHRECEDRICTLSDTSKVQRADFTVSKRYPKCEFSDILGPTGHYVCVYYTADGQKMRPGDSGAGYIALENRENTGCIDLETEEGYCKRARDLGWCESSVMNLTDVVPRGYLRKNCALTCNHCTNPNNSGIMRWQLYGIHKGSKRNKYGYFTDVHSQSMFKWICDNAPELNVPWACAR